MARILTAATLGCSVMLPNGIYGGISLTRTKKGLLGVAAIAAAVVTASVGMQAYAASTMYMRTYYTDASLSAIAGSQMDSCNNGRLSKRPLVGTATPYFTDEAIGTCPGGYW